MSEKIKNSLGEFGTKKLCETWQVNGAGSTGVCVMMEVNLETGKIKLTKPGGNREYIFYESEQSVASTVLHTLAFATELAKKIITENKK